MRKLLAIPLILAALPAFSADYREEKKTLDEHQPAPWLTTLPEAVAAAPAPRPESALPQAPEIRAEPFFSPDEKRAAELAPVALDVEKSSKLLAVRLTLPDVEILALARSPRLAAARAELTARRNGFELAASLGETLRVYDAYTGSSMPEVGGAMKEPGGYPYPSVSTLRSSVVKADVSQGAEKTEEETGSVLTTLRVAFHELFYIVEALKVEEKRLELLSMLVSTAETRYANGQGMLGEVAMLKSEVEKSREMLVTLASERRMKESVLLSLLALPQDTKLATPEAAPVPAAIPELALLGRKARENSRAIKLMRLDAARMEAMVAMSESMTFGTFGQATTVLEANPTALSEAGGGAMGASAYPSLTQAAASGTAQPKRTAFSTDTEYLRQTKSRLAAAKKAIESEEYATDAMVYESWFAFDKAKREEALYRDRVSEYAKLALDVNSSAYRNGAAPFTLVFSTYREWLDSALGAAKSRSELGVALANLEKTVGVSPLESKASSTGEQSK